VKGALFTALGTILVAAAVVVAAYLWPSGEPEGALKETELAWIEDYHDWLDDDAGCPEVPPATTERFREVERRARAACRGDAEWASVNRAISARLFVRRPLPVSAEWISESHINPPIARVASTVAKREVQVRCWSEEDWERANRELSTVYPRLDYWLAGFAEAGGHIHLDGSLCTTLSRFFRTMYTPSRNLDRAALAEALLVLAHEAEHERDFTNSEAEVECYAIQHVRGLVRNEGRSKSFEDDIAAWAWELSYPRGDPVYATERCRNGGPLDLRPASNVWP
jgi:hypothetical protein